MKFEIDTKTEHLPHQIKGRFENIGKLKELEDRAGIRTQ